MAKLYSGAKMSTLTTGTGTITLASAVSGFLTFAQAGVANSDVVSYGIIDGTALEIGTGTYTSAGTTLTRTVTLSTNANAAINLSGSAVVFLTPRKEDLLSITETQTANTSFAGPTAGGAAAPTFRALVAADIPSLDAGKITTGTIATARLGSGTANSGTYLRGDQTWAAITAGQPIPTSSTLAVGSFALLIKTSAGSVANHSTIAGSNLELVIGTYDSTLTGHLISKSQINGTAQTGTWTNVSGATLVQNSQTTNPSLGYFVRTA
jgi:hypothetical protein